MFTTAASSAAAIELAVAVAVVEAKVSGNVHVVMHNMDEPVEISTGSYHCFGSGSAWASARVVAGSVSSSSERDNGNNGFVGYCARVFAAVRGAVLATRGSYPGSEGRTLHVWGREPQTAALRIAEADAAARLRARADKALRSVAAAATDGRDVDLCRSPGWHSAAIAALARGDLRAAAAEVSSLEDETEGLLLRALPSPSDAADIIAALWAREAEDFCVTEEARAEAEWQERDAAIGRAVADANAEVDEAESELEELALAAEVAPSAALLTALPVARRAAAKATKGVEYATAGW